MKRQVSFNTVVGLFDSSRMWTNSFGDVKRIACNYFLNLYTLTKPSNFGIFTSDFQIRVSDVINSELIKPVSKKKIEATIFSIDSNKVPRKDRLTDALF